jgi:hypothetical protein
MKGHCGDLGNNDPPEPVGKGCINTDKFHFQNLLGILYDSDCKIFLKTCEVKDILVLLILDNLFFLEF